ncbi:calcium-transporting ATPase 2, plasma membrane-type-like [Rhododendron vialii]|uniref:calcium-transporting ATPase 2, plasma membrane-type-like n=1 Tax=Rhododendron vialii TaxID=182163 RepID=UPI00265F8B16|nr:calcium-transporting ATPase 2, plasma membrane-type-like [Rhododendron vialii]
MDSLLKDFDVPAENPSEEMDILLQDFDIRAENPSEEAQRRERYAVSVVRNRRRRFHMVADLVKRSAAETKILKNQEKLRVAVLVSRAAIQFLKGVQPIDYVVPEEVKAAGFDICGDELGSLVEDNNLRKLEYHGGVAGIANKLSTSITTGLSTDGNLLNRRKEIFGINKFTESQQRSFWVYVWEALQDMTLMILGVCAFLSLIVGLTTEGWPEGAHYGLGIVASIMLVVVVTAISDYRQSLQFRDLEKEKKKRSIQVTRNGCQQKMSIYDLLPGDIVHLSIGDQVPADGLFVSGFSVEIDESSLTGESEPVMVTADPADGLFVSGFSVEIDESSLTGESEPVMVTAEHPFLLSGTKVQDGSCTMMITTVGMRTRWGKLMTTLSKGGDDETPLQEARKHFDKASLLYDQVILISVAPCLAGSQLLILPCYHLVTVMGFLILGHGFHQENRRPQPRHLHLPHFGTRN